MQANASSDRWSRWRLPVLGLAIALIVVLPFLFLRAIMQSNVDATQMINHTRQVESTVHGLVSDIRNTEASALALAAGIDTPAIRERLASSAAQIPQQFDALAALTVDNPAQQRRIGELKATLEQRHRLTSQITGSADERRLRASADTLVTRYPVQRLTDAIIAAERRLLAERSDRAKRLSDQGDLLTWAMMFTQLLLLGLVVFFSQRQTARRLQIERELQRASARSQSVLQTVREPIVLIDEQQRVVMHNAAFAELYGEADETQMQGQLLAEIGDGAWQDPVILQRLADVLSRDRELWDYEQRQRTSDDNDRVMLVNARRMPLPDRDDRVVLLTVSDITARKATENQINELNRQLEGKVEQVSDVNRELEAFSYSVSHDLRAPLRHVSGFADKLGRHLGDQADDKSLHYVEVISSSAKRMATLIDDLLVYSRLGRGALRLQAVDMQSLVAETRAILDANVAADDPDRHVQWRIAPLPMLVADENMMRQVWLNLLGNAVKYSANRDTPVIEVGHQRLNDGSHQFSVRDNGAGFDMQYAGKLFGVFQRMHKASEYAGTGIGLASVRRVLVRHGGRIHAEAEVDAGAAFHFVLPSNLDRTTTTREPIA